MDTNNGDTNNRNTNNSDTGKGNRQDAQQRVDAIHAFHAELTRLEQAKVVELSDVQRNSIASYHQGLLADLQREFDIDRDSRSKQLSIGMRVASLLGALAFAASIFLLFYQYWGMLSTVTQVSVLVGASLISFVLTVVIRHFDSTGYFTKLAALVAFACFVLNVEMFGRIFNIAPSDKAFLVWAALAFLFAYSCDLKLMLAVGLICVMAFVSARVGEWGGMYWLDMGERPENFFPAAMLVFCVPMLVQQSAFSGFAATYRLVSALVTLLSILVLCYWGQGSYLEWNDEAIEHFYQVLGFVVSAGFIAAGAKWHWRELTNVGITFFVIFLFTKFYDWWWDTMPKYLFFMTLGLTALLILLILRRVRYRDSSGVRHEY